MFIARGKGHGEARLTERQCNKEQKDDFFTRLHRELAMKKGWSALYNPDATEKDWPYAADEKDEGLLLYAEETNPHDDFRTVLIWDANTEGDYPCYAKVVCDMPLASHNAVPALLPTDASAEWAGCSQFYIEDDEDTDENNTRSGVDSYAVFSYYFLGNNSCDAGVEPAQLEGDDIETIARNVEMDDIAGIEFRIPLSRVSRDCPVGAPSRLLIRKLPIGDSAALLGETISAQNHFWLPYSAPLHQRLVGGMLATHRLIDLRAFVHVLPSAWDRCLWARFRELREDSSRAVGGDEEQETSTAVGTLSGMTQTFMSLLRSDTGDLFGSFPASAYGLPVVEAFRLQMTAESVKALDPDDMEDPSGEFSLMHTMLERGLTRDEYKGLESQWGAECLAPFFGIIPLDFYEAFSSTNDATMDTKLDWLEHVIIVEKGYSFYEVMAYVDLVVLKKEIVDSTVPFVVDGCRGMCFPGILFAVEPHSAETKMVVVDHFHTAMMELQKRLLSQKAPLLEGLTRTRTKPNSLSYHVEALSAAAGSMENWARSRELVDLYEKMTWKNASDFHTVEHRLCVRVSDVVDKSFVRGRFYHRDHPDTPSLTWVLGQGNDQQKHVDYNCNALYLNLNRLHRDSPVNGDTWEAAAQTHLRTCYYHDGIPVSSSLLGDKPSVVDHVYFANKKTTAFPTELYYDENGKLADCAGKPAVKKDWWQKGKNYHPLSKMLVFCADDMPRNPTVNGEEKFAKAKYIKVPNAFGHDDTGAFNYGTHADEEWTPKAANVYPAHYEFESWKDGRRQPSSSGELPERVTMKYGVLTNILWDSTPRSTSSDEVNMVGLVWRNNKVELRVYYFTDASVKVETYTIDLPLYPLKFNEDYRNWSKIILAQMDAGEAVGFKDIQKVAEQIYDKRMKNNKNFFPRLELMKMRSDVTECLKAFRKEQEKPTTTEYNI